MLVTRVSVAGLVGVCDTRVSVAGPVGVCDTLWLLWLAGFVDL